MQRREAAARLLQKRNEISGELAALVKHWPKYSAHFAENPESFAEFETAALVDYMAAYLEHDDATFRDLYIGEKAKQFHDPATPPEERRRREAGIIAGERGAFLNYLRDLSDASDAVAKVFDAIRDALTREAAQELRVLLIGDCLFLDVIAFLTAPALADGVRLVPTYVTPHDVKEIEQALARLTSETFDLVFLSPFTYAFLPTYGALQRPRLSLQPAEAIRRAAAAVSEAEIIFDSAADLFDCPIVAHLPAPLLRHSDSAREHIIKLVTAPFRIRAVNALRRSLEQRASGRNARGQSIMLLDEKEVVATVGLRQAGRYYHQLALQHPARFGALVPDRYSDILFAAARLIGRKLVVCDLDNTLWEGTIGEGLGIKHYQDRQQVLVKLKARGVVLAINSKNDPAKVVWERAAGGLGIDDFVSRQISWDPKAIGMRRIAAHLNLKEKDFVFIDDRADERAMIEEAYPAMITLDSADPRTWRVMAMWAALLPERPDADRTDFYRQRDEREAFISANLETSETERAAMYRGLDLRLLVREAGEADVARVTDLINRTNQFNMAGTRATKREVEEWIADSGALVLIADAADRFGSMGTIAVLVAVRSGDRLELPVFVMSCRVFGYGMEFAILAQAVQLVEPGKIVLGRVRETDYNQPCREVYRTAGFAAVAEGWQLERKAEPGTLVPDWLSVETRVTTFP